LIGFKLLAVGFVLFVPRPSPDGRKRVKQFDAAKNAFAKQIGMVRGAFLEGLIK